jgi:hypothetical protein
VKLRPLIWAGILAAVAFSVGPALVTHDGVGALEYVVGIALVVLLAGAALSAARRAVAG